MKIRSIFSADRLAILLSLAAVVAAYGVTRRTFEGIPHLEDEFAYTWQAKVFALGKAYLPSPEYPKSFLVPFVVDYQGKRFSKYSPGWSLLLSLGVLLGLRNWVNPLLAGLGVWLTYQMGKKVLNPTLGLVAAGLTLTSPFFLMNSGSLLNHPLGLVLSAAFAIAWLDAFASASSKHPWRSTLLAAVLIGCLSLTRPWTAVGVALPFGLHGLWVFWRGVKPVRWRLLTFALLAGAISALFFAWQYWMTGNPLLNPYTLWWPFDKIGFGPGYGVIEGGHTLEQAYFNTVQSLGAGWSDIFGWISLSWLFLPLGLWAARRNARLLLFGGVYPALALVYMAYYIGARLYGPRYYYEGLYSMTLLTAAGIAIAGGWPPGNKPPAVLPIPRPVKLRRLLVTGLLTALVGINVFVYAPLRLERMHDLYGISAEDQEPFLTAKGQELAPALIIVHSDRWMEYGALLDLENPSLTSPFIFAWDISEARDAQVAASFPDRKVFHYYPETPWLFYTAPLPEPPVQKP